MSLKKALAFILSSRNTKKTRGLKGTWTDILQSSLSHWRLHLTVESLTQKQSLLSSLPFFPFLAFRYAYNVKVEAHQSAAWSLLQRCMNTRRKTKYVRLFQQLFDSCDILTSTKKKLDFSSELIWWSSTCRVYTPTAEHPAGERPWSLQRSPVLSLPAAARSGLFQKRTFLEMF